MDIKQLIISILLISFNSLFSIQVAELPKQEQEVITKVATLLKSSHSTEQTLVWPGYDLTDSPVVITFKSGHIFVFNMQSEKPEWQMLALKEGTILYSPEDHWGFTRSAFQPQFPLEGHKAYVFNLDNAAGQQGTKSYQILVHERFHRYQFEHFHVEHGGMPYQDHLNSENLALGKLEEKILAEFMKAHGKPELQLEHLRNFAAVNSVRRAVIQPGSVDWEDHQEMMEGLADYVSYKILDVFPIIPGYAGHDDMTELLEREAANTDYSDHAIKWRHYSIGAALGYALDFLKVPNWKEEIEQGHANLLQILKEQLALSVNEIETRFENCQMQYQWDETNATVASSVHKFEEEIEKHMSAYEKMEGIVVEIGRPRAGLSGSGKNERLIYLADGSTLSIQDTLFSSSEDNLWKLQLERVPYVFKKGGGCVEFKVEAETEVEIDNQKYKLKELKQQETHKLFTHIEIHGKQMQFASDQHHGLLTISKEGILSVSF